MFAHSHARYRSDKPRQTPRRVHSPPSSTKTPYLCTCALRTRKCAPYQAISSLLVRKFVDLSIFFYDVWPLALESRVLYNHRFDVSIAYSSRDLLSTLLCDRIFKSVSLLKMDLSCDFFFFFFECFNEFVEYTYALKRSWRYLFLICRNIFYLNFYVYLHLKLWNGDKL